MRTKNLISRNNRHIPYNPALKQRSRELRKYPTDAERKLWQFLRTREETWLRQKPIDHFIVDFFCSSFKLVIELDGSQHYSDDGKEYDQARTDILSGYGLTVLRFSNVDVTQNFYGVCTAIVQAQEIPSVPFDKGMTEGLIL